MASLVKELKRRNVFRVAIGYLILGWVVLQITDIVAPALRLPEWTITLVLLLGVIGFPFALFFAWAFELTPEGLKREHEVDRSKSITHYTGRKVDFAIIGLLAVALAFVVTDNYVLLDEPDKNPVTVEESFAAGQAYDSIAVLPFHNMSSDPEQEFFSDGIAEELLNALARLRNLKVAARTSAFAFKEQQTDIREIGQALNVATVLEGSLRKSGNRLRITAQLIDVETGFHLWSETYDRELTDVFAIQDDITAQIMAALKVHLEVGETNQVTSTINPEAYQAYIQGRQQLHERTLESIQQAHASFERATSLDPGYALAWAGQALAVFLQGDDSYGDLEIEATRVRTQALINRALELNPKLAEAHAVRGLSHPDPIQERRALDQAVTLNPGVAEFHLWRSNALQSQGRYKDSKESLERAFELDPLHPAILAALGQKACWEWNTPVEPLLDAMARYPSQQTNVKIQCQTAKGEYARAWETVESATIVLRLDFAKYFTSLFLKRCDSHWIRQESVEKDTFVQAIHCQDDDLAMQRYAAIPEQQQRDPRVLDYLSVVQLRQKKYAAFLATLDERFNDSAPTLDFQSGSFVAGGHLYLNRILALQLTGREEEALGALETARQALDRSKAAGMIRGYHIFEAKILLLSRNHNAGLQSLDKAFRNFEVTWRMRRDPVVMALVSPEELAELTGWYDEHIDAERAKLGWPPAEF
jgi:TolB-like protein